jgi:protoporphyrinogen oxidase
VPSARTTVISTPDDHQKLTGRIWARLAALYFAGNAYEGIGIPDCIRLGQRAAQGVSATTLS